MIWLVTQQYPLARYNGFGGKVNPQGETVAEAALRELKVS